jgi:alpha-pyrone synthase
LTLLIIHPVKGTALAAQPVFINAIAGKVPPHDVHRHFIAWAEQQIQDRRMLAVFRRMAERSGIEHRWSVLPLPEGAGSPAGPGGFYGSGAPSTAERMHVYADAAPRLALQAIGELAEQRPLEGITHLVAASCTGFMAPGVDQIIAEALGIPEVERTLVGFMGCYAAVAALRLGRHIVRSKPQARVLVVTVELSSIHLQEKRDLGSLLAMLQFSDGAGAALLSAETQGFELGEPFALSLPETADLIRWTIGDKGFEMFLSGEVPGRLASALAEPKVRSAFCSELDPRQIDLWAVHPGGRSILDAVERGLELPSDALAASRSVLARHGNMSSSTLMFVLAELLREERGHSGVAVAFGPGLAAEGFRFERA